MMAMAQGALVKKGSFTVPQMQQDGESFYISLDKTVSKYVIVVEGTNDTKQALIDSGISGNRVFMWVGIFPNMQIDNRSISADALTGRINAATSELSAATTAQIRLYDDRFGFDAFVLKSGGSAWGVYQGYTYNYWVFEIK